MAQAKIESEQKPTTLFRLTVWHFRRWRRLRREFKAIVKDSTEFYSVDEIAQKFVSHSLAGAKLSPEESVQLVRDLSEMELYKQRIIWSLLKWRIFLWTLLFSTTLHDQNAIGGALSDGGVFLNYVASRFREALLLIVTALSILEYEYRDDLYVLPIIRRATVKQLYSKRLIPLMMLRFELYSGIGARALSQFRFDQRFPVRVWPGSIAARGLSQVLGLGVFMIGLFFVVVCVLVDVWQYPIEPAWFSHAVVVYAAATGVFSFYWLHAFNFGMRRTVIAKRFYRGMSEKWPDDFHPRGIKPLKPKDSDAS